MKDNQNIINQFKLLAKQIKIEIDNSKGKKMITNTFRLQSISKVIKILESYTKKIKSAEQLKGTPGIGKSSLKRIDEILKTGKLSEIDMDLLSSKYLEYIDELEKIFGIGRKKALELYNVHKIKSIQDLKDAVKNKKIDLPDNILKGLKYVDQIKTKIPRSEIDEINIYIIRLLSKIDLNLFGIICGSYRRLKETSGDIDLIITHHKIITKERAKKTKYLHDVICKMIDDGFIVDSLTGIDVETKYMGICKFKNNPLRRIDIRFIPYESYFTAILYFTGSMNFNRMMRQIAIDNGYTLNEYGLFDENGKMFKVESEKEIFELLDMEYVTPDKRI